MYKIFSDMLKENQSPVQTENEQTNSLNFEKLFRETYSKLPVETILEHFLQCHLDLGYYIDRETELEEQLMILIRTEVGNA